MPPDEGYGYVGTTRRFASAAERDRFVAAELRAREQILERHRRHPIQTATKQARGDGLIARHRAQAEQEAAEWRSLQEASPLADELRRYDAEHAEADAHDELVQHGRELDQAAAVDELRDCWIDEHGHGTDPFRTEA
jgi:hypothetical protein